MDSARQKVAFFGGDGPTGAGRLRGKQLPEDTEGGPKHT